MRAPEDDSIEQAAQIHVQVPYTAPSSDITVKLRCRELHTFDDVGLNWMNTLERDARLPSSASVLVSKRHSDVSLDRRFAAPVRVVEYILQLPILRFTSRPFGERVVNSLSPCNLWTASLDSLPSLSSASRTCRDCGLLRSLRAQRRRVAAQQPSLGRCSQARHDSLATSLLTRVVSDDVAERHTKSCGSFCIPGARRKLQATSF